MQVTEEGKLVQEKDKEAHMFKVYFTIFTVRKSVLSPSANLSRKDLQEKHTMVKMDSNPLRLLLVVPFSVQVE